MKTFGLFFTLFIFCSLVTGGLGFLKDLSIGEFLILNMLSSFIYYKLLKEKE